jgi:hypothetical protein
MRWWRRWTWVWRSAFCSCNRIWWSASRSFLQCEWQLLYF